MSLHLMDLPKHDRELTVTVTEESNVVEHDTKTSSSSSEWSSSSSSEEEPRNMEKLKKARKARHKPLYINNDGGAKILYCFYCKEYFNRTPDHPKNFLNHIRRVHAISNDHNGTFTCRHCSHITPNKTKMRRHFDIHRIFDDPRVCHDCGEAFYNYRDWRSHCKKHQKVRKSFGCYLCGNVYTSKPSLISHLMSIHEQLGRKCKFCNKCVLFEEWDEHEKLEKELHNETVAVICEICAQTFTSKESAANHRRNFHLNKPKVSCTECGKTFRTTTNLAQHRTNTHAEKRFECQYCGYRSSYKYLVHIHIKRIHPSIIATGMPENAVLEHEPGTAGRQDNRRKRLITPVLS